MLVHILHFLCNIRGEPLFLVSRVELFKHTDLLIGPFKCLSQAPQTVNMAFNFDVILGYHDGLS